jgi:hypothetical protein
LWPGRIRRSLGIHSNFKLSQRDARISALSAICSIFSCPAIYLVVAIPALHKVISCASIEHVISYASHQEVPAIASKHLVIASSTIHTIDSVFAMHFIITCPAACALIRDLEVNMGLIDVNKSSR